MQSRFSMDTDKYLITKSAEDVPNHSSHATYIYFVTLFISSFSKFCVLLKKMRFNKLAHSERICLLKAVLVADEVEPDRRV